MRRIQVYASLRYDAISSKSLALIVIGVSGRSACPKEVSPETVLNFDLNEDCDLE